MAKQEKYAFSNLRAELVECGKTFTDFMDEAARQGSTTSRRSWANATNKNNGVVKTTANAMAPFIPKVFEIWDWKFDKSAISYEVINTGSEK